jgi:hypothetical protein
LGPPIDSRGLRAWMDLQVRRALEALKDAYGCVSSFFAPAIPADAATGDAAQSRNIANCAPFYSL